MILERELGEESDFAAEHAFFVDYVTPTLLRCTPPGWQERVTIIDLAPGLKGHCLDAHDVAYNPQVSFESGHREYGHGL